MQPQYRNVFISGYKLKYNHADIANGYYSDPKKRKVFEGKNREAKQFFPRFFAEMKKAVDARGYTKTIQLQFDLCAVFFNDMKRGVFGFFWDGAEQFVCPYENVIDVTVWDDAHTKSGGRGGSRYICASHSEVKITFYTPSGAVSTYTLDLNGHRSYYWINGRKDKAYEDGDCLRRKVDSDTRQKLEQVRNEILSVRAIGTQIQEGKYSVPEVDIASLEKQAEGSEARYKKNEAEVIAVHNKAVKRQLTWKILKYAIPIGFAAICILGIVILLS